MRLDRLTNKFQLALADAQSLALPAAMCNLLRI